MSDRETAGYKAASQAWREACLSPLWESVVAFNERAAAPKPLHWPWSRVRPLIDQGVVTLPMRSTGNSICVVVEGRGISQVGTETFDWAPKDVFTLPQGNWISHRAGGETAYLFIYSDREVYARLGLLKEEYGNRPAP